MTDLTFPHIGMEISEGLCKIRYIGTIGLEKEKCELRSCLFSYPREIVDHIDDALEGFWHRGEGKVQK
jgi:hypothetical protein